MNIAVHVQVWGPFEASGAGYRWITIGVIEEPSDFNLRSLKKQAAEIIRKSSYPMRADMARLLFTENGTVYMKTTFVDVWKE